MARSSCDCKNICNQTMSKRCSCPCLIRGAYCTSSCSCGTSRFDCINRSGKGGQLDMELQMLSLTEDEDSDADPDWMMVSFEEGQDLRVSVQDLDMSLQEAVEQQHPTTDSEDPIPPVSAGRLDEVTDPLFKIRDANRNELLNIIQQIVAHSPDTVQFLTIGNGTSSSGVSSSMSDKLAHQSAASNESRPLEAPASPPGPTPRPDPSPGASWCKCGRCINMPTPREQLCCRKKNGPCITQTAAADMNVTVLDRRMLVVCIRDRNEVFILNDDVDAHDSLRHMAYRRFILWKYGHLGAYNRRVIPSCVVREIRRKYPSPDNVYTGYIPSRLN